MENQLARLASRSSELGIARRQPLRGALAQRLAASAPAVLAKSTNQALAAVQTGSDDKLAQRMEMLSSGALNVVIACDYSASTAGLHATLQKVATTTDEAVRRRCPTSSVKSGVFGGGDLQKIERGTEATNNGHVGTDGWQSSFDKFASLFLDQCDPLRRNVLIAFNDAAPSHTSALDDAIRGLNALQTIVVVVYVPSSGSGNSDKTCLQDLANPETGFDFGVFLDFSGVDINDPGTLQKFVKNITEAITASSKTTGCNSQQSFGEAATTAHEKFKALAAGVLAGLQASNPPTRKLLK